MAVVAREEGHRAGEAGAALVSAVACSYCDCTEEIA